MSAWLKRFALHLAAAVGATGVFVAAAAVGANQNRPHIAAVSQPIPIVRTRRPTTERKPTVVVTPTPTQTSPPSVAVTSEPTAEPTSPPTSQPVAAPNPRPQVPAPQPQEPAPQTQDAASQPQEPAPQPPTRANQAPPRSQTRPTPTSASKPAAVVPERSLSGTIKAVQGDGLDVLGVGGREWHVLPVPGALIRLNGKPVKLDALQAGQSVVILGQAQPGPGSRFLAHAITAKTK